MSSWTRLAMRGSRTLVSPRSLKTCMRFGTLQTNMITVYDGLHRRFWTIGACIARKRMFSHLRWSRSRFVAVSLLGVNIWLNPIKAFTGAVPFSDRSPRAAMLAIVWGRRPSRPSHPALTDELWTLTQQCWDQEVRRRPQVSQILRGL